MASQRKLLPIVEAARRGHLARRRRLALSRRRREHDPFHHVVTDEPIALVRLASDEGAVLHLVRCQHEPDAPDGLLLDCRTLCGRWAREHVVQILSEESAPENWFLPGVPELEELDQNHERRQAPAVTSACFSLPRFPQEEDVTPVES